MEFTVCNCQGAWGERWGEDFNAGEWVFNNKIKLRLTKNTKRGKTGR